MSKIIDYLDILIAKLCIWSLERCYGKGCPDYCSRCPTCEAGQTVKWLEDHIKLIKGK